MVFDEMRSAGLDLGLDDRVESACFLPVRESTAPPRASLVVLDKFATEAVMQAAHLYSPRSSESTGERQDL